MLPALALGLSLASASGCGLFGEKEEPPGTLHPEMSKGCLNEIGPQLKQYFDGQIDEASWSANWECFAVSLNQFTGMVKGSVETGYTREDMWNFTNGFLVTNRPVSLELVSAVFEMKATLFGGSREILSLEEIGRFQEFLRTFSAESASLVPHFRQLSSTPSSETALAADQAMRRAGMNVASTIRADANPPLPVSTIRTLLSATDFPSEYLDLLAQAKVVALGGNDTELAGSEVGKVIEAGAAVSWLTLTARAFPDDSATLGELWSERLAGALEPVPNAHGGKVPVAAMEGAIRAIPARHFADADSREGFAQLLRPMKSLLIGGTDSEITQEEWEGLRLFAVEIAPEALRILRNFPADADVARKKTLVRDALGQLESSVSALLARRHDSYSGSGLVPQVVAAAPIGSPPISKPGIVLFYRMLREIFAGGADIGLSPAEASAFVSSVLKLGDPVSELYFSTNTTWTRQAVEFVVSQLGKIQAVFEDSNQYRLGTDQRCANLTEVASLLRERGIAESWIALIGPAKALLLGGSPSIVKVRELQSFFGLVAELALPLFDLRETLSSQAALDPSELHARLRPLVHALAPLVERHGGSLSFDAIDGIFAVVPPEWSSGTLSKLSSDYAYLLAVLNGNIGRAITVGEARWLASLFDQHGLGLLELALAKRESFGSERDYQRFLLTRAKSLIEFMVDHLPAGGGAIELAWIERLLADFVPGGTAHFGAFAAAKQVLVGGSASAFSAAEWRDTLKALKLLTIPLNRLILTDDPDYAALMLEIRDTLLGIIRNHGGALSFELLDTLLDRLPTIMESVTQDELKSLYPAWKTLLVSGSARAITEPEARTLFGIAHDAAAPLIAFARESAITPAFVQREASRLVAALEPAFRQHGGAIPLDVIDSVIDVAPNGLMPAWFAGNEAALKATLRPLARTVLDGRSDTGLEWSAMSLALSFLAEGVRAQDHLTRIFDAHGLNPSTVANVDFLRAATTHLGSVPESEKPAVRRLIRLAETFRPLFQGSDAEITFARGNRNSLHNLELTMWLDLTVGHLMQRYSSVDGTKATYPDFHRLFDDFDDLGEALGIIQGLADEQAPKRFREADLFTFASNGDAHMDVVETTYYLAYVLSTKSLSRRMMSRIGDACATGELDHLGWRWMEAHCFRREFYGSYEYFWSYLPYLRGFWRRSADGERGQIMRAIETASRAEQYSDAPIASADSEAMAGIFQYLETMIIRFDTNADGNIGTDEAAEVFPIVRQTLADEIRKRYPDLKANDRVLESIFTYLLKYSELPDGCSAGGLAKFVAWHLRRPLWEIDADRLDLYTMLSQLTAKTPDERVAGCGDQISDAIDRAERGN